MRTLHGTATGLYCYHCYFHFEERSLWMWEGPKSLVFSLDLGPSHTQVFNYHCRIHDYWCSLPTASNPCWKHLYLWYAFLFGPTEQHRTRRCWLLPFQFCNMSRKQQKHKVDIKTNHASYYTFSLSLGAWPQGKSQCIDYNGAYRLAYYYSIHFNIVIG